MKREIKLAIAAVAALFILVWGINFLKSTSLFEKSNHYYAVYDRVDGLKISSSVSYRGYKVGQVDEISFIGKSFNKVVVSFNVDKKLSLPSNSIARISSSDIMGTKEIQLVPGDAYFYAENRDTLIGEQEATIIQQLNEHIAPMKSRAEELMNSVDSLLVIMQDILNDGKDGNLKGSLMSVGKTLNNLEHATGTLDTMLTISQPRITNIVTNVDSIVGILVEHKIAISRGIANITDLTDSLTQLNVVSRLNKILVMADSVASKINNGEGSLGELINNDDLYFNLNTILSGFQNNPKRYINVSVFGGNSNKENVKYGVAIYETNKPLYLTHEIFAKYPDIRELHKNGTFYYVLGAEKRLSAAEKSLEKLVKEYPDAVIVKF